ncbi:MAG: SGNH/GDSL hydrolase family protein [Clostridia bacterium]|nr:SGNH/GDSL hydrolase family protein [Clostridia bacterium]
MSYKNKRILFMGDSITELGTGDRGWVKYFNEIIEPSFFVNVAVIGARFANEQPVEFDGNPVFLGDDTDCNQNVLLNQVEKISRAKDKNNKNYCYNSDFEDFDLIIIAAGTNDVFVKEKCNIDTIEEQFTLGEDTLPIEDVNYCTVAGGMRCVYEKLRALYPSAKIFFCSPVQGNESMRSYESILYKRNLISAVCDRISDVTFVDTFNCGICGIYEKTWAEGRDLIDGLHPNANGAKKIGLYNALAVKNSII